MARAGCISGRARALRHFLNATRSPTSLWHVTKLVLRHLHNLLGCWFTDIGWLNQMIVLRGFTDLATLQAERDRAQKNADPLGSGAVFRSLEQHSYKGFPG